MSEEGTVGSAESDVEDGVFMIRSAIRHQSDDIVRDRRSRLS